MKKEEVVEATKNYSLLAIPINSSVFTRSVDIRLFEDDIVGDDFIDSVTVSSTGNHDLVFESDEGNGIKYVLNVDIFA